jgi:aspartate/methionine/tyrosine aminotransferase
VDLPAFRLERFFARHEFTARYILSASDCETWSLAELLGHASDESLDLWNRLRFGYTESQGHPLLRHEVAAFYESLQPDDVLIAVPEEAIFILMHAVLGASDHAVVVTPAYQSLYDVALSTGCDVTRIALRAESARWRLDLEDLERSLNERTRLMVVNFPHNPTGYMPARAEFEAIVEMARKRGIYLFSDEMYRLLEHDPELRFPAVCDVYEKGVSLSGLSKSFGLPGLRLGWLATRDRTLLERCSGWKDYTTICASAPSEILGIMALRSRDDILTRNRRILARNLEVARSFFREYGGVFRWIEPEGGPVAFPEWIGRGSVEDFCGRVLDDSAVLLAHGALFEHPGGHFRIGMGRSNFQDALGRLGDFVKSSDGG